MAKQPGIMTENDLYNRPPIRIVMRDEGKVSIELRASAINSCPRQLWYHLNAEPQSDETPARSQRMLDMGKSLEGVVADTLTATHEIAPGWVIIPDGMLLRNRMGDIDGAIDWYITGMPDFVARPIASDDQSSHMVEIKTRSADAFRKVVNQGNLSAQPGAVMQLAAYRLAGNFSLDEVGRLHDDSMIVTMNRSDGDIHVEYFTEETLAEVMADVDAQWQERLDKWIYQPDEEPARLKQDAWQCQTCVFRTTCGNLVPEQSPAEQDKGIPVDDEEFADALYHFCSWKEQEALNSMPKSVKENWDRVGLSYFMRHGIDKLNGVENGEGVFNISLQDSGRETLNVEKVRYHLPPSIFQQCLEVRPGKPYLVVRKARSRKGE